MSKYEHYRATGIELKISANMVSVLDLEEVEQIVTKTLKWKKSTTEQKLVNIMTEHWANEGAHLPENAVCRTCVSEILEVIK